MILNKPSSTKVNILGTEYTIIVEKEEDNSKFEDGSCDGYFDSSVKEIHIAITNPEDDDKKDIIAFRKSIVRHEIIHGFLWESGLDVSSGCYNSWAKNEEMVDWIAIQFHKIEKVFKELKV